jgi:tyrosine-protein kinase Etk/Wzc
LAVLVVEAGRVPVKIAQRMREMLITIKAPVAGIVFNDKSGKGETYEYYGSRYYGKGYGYGYYSDENGNGKSKSTIIAKLMPEKKGKR